MKYDGLIFDIDGTLWDATWALEESWNETLEKLGLEKRVTRDEMKSVMGKPLEECVDILLPETEMPKEKIHGAILENNLGEIAKKKAMVYPGVKEGMEKLSKNHPLFLVSNCGESYLNIFLNLSGVRPYLTATDCVGLSHLPKSEMIKNTIKKYSLQNPVYIGDTISDLEGAKGAGVDFIHAAYGFGQIAEKVVAFNSFSELAEYFKKK